MHRSEPPPAETAQPARPDTRVDPPHLVRNAPSAGVEASASSAGWSAPPEPPGVPLSAPATSAAQFVQQVQNQAAQLAERLQLQQKELDQREAELNARLAAVENQVRSARLWADERQKALDDREAQVARQEQLAAQKLAELGIVCQGDSIGQVESELVRRANAVAERESALARREAELDEVRKGYQQRATELDVRQRYLEKTEALLADEQQTLSEIRQRFDAQLAELEQQRIHLRDQYATRRTRLEAEYRSRQRDLEQRSADLEKREMALERLRDELCRSQREVLEIRLATEELCSELGLPADPSAFQTAIARIRARLADHYSLTRADLKRRHEALEQLGRRVLEQHQKLQQQKEDLIVWVRRREGDLDQQAARIVARERELERRASRCEEERLEWQEERLAYQREIRQLFSKLHQREDRAA